MTELKLEIELVPASSWGNNLRSILKPKMWKEISKSVRKKAKGRCEICGKKSRLHAHEIWEYEDKKHIQRLENIIAICPLCHGIKHLGKSELDTTANYDRLVKHFQKVNTCDLSTFKKERTKAFKDFEKRSRHQWHLDVTKLLKILN